MAKRVILVHGWDANSRSDWFPWLKFELEKKGLEVIAPDLPDPHHPKIETWVTELARAVNEVKKDDIFIGHSIGVQTILRFLEKLPSDEKVSKVIAVAGWFSLEHLEDEEVDIAKPWLNTPINFAKVKKHARSFIAVFSDNDPYVPLEENVKAFAAGLGAEVIVEKGMGHFTYDEVKRLPLLLALCN